MQIRQQLLAKHSRANADKVAAMVFDDHDRLVELMACFLSDEVVVAQRAAQAVGYVGRSEPHWLLPWACDIVDAIENPVHQAIRRNGVRYFSELAEPLDDGLEARLIDLCSAFVADPKTDVAIGAFAMDFVAERADKYPKHAKKLKRDLKKLMPTASSGLKNRARKTLAKLGE